MPYVIDPKVTINGVEYKDKAISGITLTSGRTRVDEQPRAGFASITLVTADNTYPAIKIDEKVVVKVDNSSGTETTLWTGWVSDIETSIASYGSNGWLNQQRITAVGTLARLNRRAVGGAGYSAEKDGDRVKDIIQETAGVTWANYSPNTDEWQDVSNLLQWQNADLLIGDIDTPGDFDLVAYSAGAASGLTLAQQAASSGLGILYEDNLGKISYADYTSRTDDLAINGFTEIPAEAILSQGLSSVTRLADLVNEIIVQYGSNQSVTDSDTNSINAYGKYAASISTLLANQIDAEQRADYYLDTRAFPRTILDKINLVLHLDQVPNISRDALLPMEISKPIRIQGLPDSVYPGNFIGFVEGFTWTINRNELFLTLTVSEYGFSQLEMNWLQVPPTVEWQDVNATLEWQEARSVA